MLASFASLLTRPLSAPFFVWQSKVSAVERDLDALLSRLSLRQYPETIPVLASYWLKTVYARGYDLREWRKLNDLLKRALGELPPNGPSRQAIIELQAWIQQAVLLTGQAPAALPPRLEPVRSSLHSERLAAYIGRLLNEWLPVEVARLLVNESESGIPPNGGIPVLATARALESLLVRERLSPATLEMLLQPELLSPRGFTPRMRRSCEI